MLFTWSNNSDEILVDGHLCQRQRATMLPEGHKACQWKLERTAEYKVVWRGEPEEDGPVSSSPLSASLPQGTMGKAGLGPCTD